MADETGIKPVQLLPPPRMRRPSLRINSSHGLTSASAMTPFDIFDSPSRRSV